MHLGYRQLEFSLKKKLSFRIEPKKNCSFSVKNGIHKMRISYLTIYEENSRYTKVNCNRYWDKEYIIHVFIRLSILTYILYITYFIYVRDLDAFYII